MKRFLLSAMAVFLFNISLLFGQTKADFTFQDSICGSLDLKFTNKSQNAGSFFWYFSPGTTNQTNPSHTFPSYGSFDVTLIAFGSGSNIDTMVKTVHLFPHPTINISGTMSILCAGDTGMLTSFLDANYSYLWRPAIWLSDSTISNPRVSALLTTRYILRVKDLLTRCEDTASYEIKVKSCRPPKSFFTYTQPPCGSFEVTFHNQSVNRFSSEWDFGDGSLAISEDADTVKYIFNSSGTYKVILKVYDSLGLYMDTFSMLIKLGDQVKASISSAGNRICRGDSIMLTGSGGIRPLRWFPNLWVSDTTGINIYVYPKTTTIYSVIAEDNGCFDTATIQIDVKEFPNFKLYADSVCVGLEINAWIKPNILNSLTKLKWTWPNGDTSSGSWVSHSTKDTGQIYIQGKLTSEGCDTDAVVNSRVFPRPQAQFDQNPTDVFITQPYVQFYNRSRYATRYRWDFGDGNYIYDTTVSHQYIDTATYTVQLIAFNEYGCTDTAQNKFTIRPDLLVFIPTAFTPNKYGPIENEKFSIFINQWLPEFEFTIWNRWGEKMFETTDQKFAWDGMFKETPCPANMYIWRMRYRVSQEKVKNDGGVFFLYR